MENIMPYVTCSFDEYREYKDLKAAFSQLENKKFVGYLRSYYAKENQYNNPYANTPTFFVLNGDEKLTERMGDEIEVLIESIREKSSRIYKLEQILKDKKIDFPQ